MDIDLKKKYFKIDDVLDTIEKIENNFDENEMFEKNEKGEVEITYPMWKCTIAKEGETFIDYLNFLKNKTLN